MLSAHAVTEEQPCAQPCAEPYAQPCAEPYAKPCAPICAQPYAKPCAPICAQPYAKPCAASCAQPCPAEFPTNPAGKSQNGKVLCVGVSLKQGRLCLAPTTVFSAKKFSKQTVLGARNPCLRWIM